MEIGHHAAMLDFLLALGEPIVHTVIGLFTWAFPIVANTRPASKVVRISSHSLNCSFTFAHRISHIWRTVFCTFIVLLPAFVLLEDDSPPSSPEVFS